MNDLRSLASRLLAVASLSMGFGVPLSSTGCTEPGRAPRPESSTGSEATAGSVEPGPEGLAIVAESERRWTGIAVDAGGRIFVSYPRWSDDVPLSVAVLEDGSPRPFPDARWNECWETEQDPARCWVCVQSVHVDGEGDLWVLDPGNPKLAGVIEGAPKLLRFALSEDPDATTPARVIRFEAPTITEASYLNDVRLDRERGLAFLTDSGDGALVVVDLADGSARRLLDDHPSTRAEDVTLTIGGVPFDRPVHADGLAYDPASGTVYYQALRGRHLYAAGADALGDASLDADALASRIRTVGETGASDGLLFAHGEVLTTALEHDAIRAVDPSTARVRDVVRDPRIAWPDSMALGPSGALLFTTAQIHLGEDPPDPFRVWRTPLR